MKNKRWYKLDNSGKIFPPNTTTYDTQVFRIVCTLNEDIKENVLQKALEKALVDFPIFNSMLHKGFFWYYIEEVENVYKVSEESNAPCDNIYGILYRLTYYKNRINLDVSHSLTDASGALKFLQCICANYLNIIYNIKNPPEIDTSSVYEKTEDAFRKYYSTFKKHKNKYLKKGYKIKKQEYDDYRVKFIEATCSSSKLISVAKGYNESLTAFLISVLILSIIKQMTEREKKKPIYITVPVNLRREFQSNTTRNFFCTVSIKYLSNGKDDLEDITKEVGEQLKLAITKDNLYSKMSEMIFLENVFILRIVPRRIKNIVLRNSFNITRRTHTMTLSNIGKIEMPEVYSKYIQSFEFLSSTDGMQLNVCSFKDVFKFSFSSHFINSEIQRNFIKFFTDLGIDCTIDTNILDNEEAL